MLLWSATRSPIRRSGALFSRTLRPFTVPTGYAPSHKGTAEALLNCSQTFDRSAPIGNSRRPPGESMPVVELAAVTKAYENKIAVNQLSLSIDAGQMFGLLGPNGAGKTSSIRMMMGITLPDSGRIDLFGKPFERASLDRVGYLPEERGLYKKMKVLDQLIFFGQLHGLAQ